MNDRENGNARAGRDPMVPGNVPATPGRKRLKKQREGDEKVKAPEDDSQDLVNTELTASRQACEL